MDIEPYVSGALLVMFLQEKSYSKGNPFSFPTSNLLKTTSIQAFGAFIHMKQSKTAQLMNLMLLQI